jgi:hypothetical protein
MHYHLEIIMPPTEDVEAAVEKIMSPLREWDGEAESNAHGFWDWWVIGGRYSGAKAEVACGEQPMAEFNHWLNEQKIMVEGLVAGKQRIADAAQVALVDAEWSRRFPRFSGNCPLFAHSNNQYDSASTLPLDVCTVSELPAELKSYRVIITDTAIKARCMLATDLWNGVTHQNTDWDGSISKALEMWTAKFASYREDYVIRNTIQPDWLVVTVDYHS